MMYNAEPEFVCSSSESFPAPRLIWSVERSNNIGEAEIIEGDTETGFSGDGSYTARSVLKVRNVDRMVERLTVDSATMRPLVRRHST